MREYTKKEKFLNWLYYNKLGIAAVAVILWVLGSMVWNLLGIGQVKPDYCFAYVGSRQLPAETVATLETALAAFGTDLNGDGRVTVSLSQHVTADPTNTDNMMYGYAANMTVLADLTAGESTFFLLEDPVSFSRKQEEELFFSLISEAQHQGKNILVLHRGEKTELKTLRDGVRVISVAYDVSEPNNFLQTPTEFLRINYSETDMTYKIVSNQIFYQK